MTVEKKTVMPWVIVGVWVLVIWGHSLMNGIISGIESTMVLGWVRNAINWFLSLDFNWTRDIVAAHPELIEILDDNQQLHLYVRKAGHLLGFFILGLLVLRACRKTAPTRRDFWAALCAPWVLVPFIDETIQLFVPGRSGEIADMLLDMGGYGAGLIFALPFIGLAALGRLIVGVVPKKEPPAEEPQAEEPQEEKSE